MVYIAIEGADNVGKTTLIQKMKPLLNEFTAEMHLPAIKYIAETEIKYESKGDKYYDASYLARAYDLQRLNLHSDLDKEKDIIISDRSICSTYAYQGEVLPLVEISDICYSIHPDRVLLLKNFDRSLREELYEKSLNYLCINSEKLKPSDEMVRQGLNKIIQWIIQYHYDTISEQFLEKKGICVKKAEG